MGKGVELPCYLGTPLSQDLRVFTSLEALQTLFFGVFMEALSHRID